ncbi:heavy-metal-associated domain-containing protein [Massilia sp. PAMC28688]|uniref:heavy-metal-associated domain-containing protein n=1 Tax=Massilia sp. PAMC28688 TaxID=2861283 RepID=UPI001C62F295|nr:heavy-metal-associated domain-containing protein [Massilia sp. PAMC28688]QYF95609.1 heavy-metal-associated domain-containing protein [Massilia sp. PAMC28688]
MIILNVPDMSCSHCTGVITKALKALDPQALIGYDMHHHKVQIDTAESTPAVLQALEQAGYPATVAA